MLKRSLDQVDSRTMTMPGAEGVEMRLMVGRDDGAPNFAMRVFDVEPGGHTPRHAHNYEHEILVLEGSGEVYNDTSGEHEPIGKGDAIYMPANQEHEFRNTGKTTLRFLCMVPVSFDCGGASQPTPGS